MPEDQSRPPRQVSPIGVVVTQMAGGVSDGGQLIQNGLDQRAEALQPSSSVGQGNSCQILELKCLLGFKSNMNKLKKKTFLSIKKIYLI